MAGDRVAVSGVVTPCRPRDSRTQFANDATVSVGRWASLATCTEYFGGETRGCCQRTSDGFWISPRKPQATDTSKYSTLRHIVSSLGGVLCGRWFDDEPQS